MLLGAMGAWNGCRICEENCFAQLQVGGCQIGVQKTGTAL